MSALDGEGSVKASAVFCVLTDMLGAEDLVGKMAAETEGRAEAVCDRMERCFPETIDSTGKLGTC